jgi:acetyl-CoA carboxylase biotin carboxyl carrier protein
MTGSESRSGDVFDMARLRSFIELMKEHDLSELDLKQEGQQIRLCRYVIEAAPRAVAHTPLPATSAAPPTPSAADERNIATIKSPMVGTFYARPNPTSEPFVKVGDRVSADKPVCLIEAMKTYNEIPAEISGAIVAVLVEDGEFVDFGRPLFKVDTSK